MAAVVASFPAHAAAGQPPVLGGEGNEVLYTGTIKGGGNIEVRLGAASDRVTHMFLQNRRVVRCQRRTDPDVGLWQTPFWLGADRRAVKRERSGDKAGARRALMIWDVRFAADWATATVRVSDRYRHNTLGNCAGTFKVTLKHTLPRNSWQLGRYAGTTSQGQPVAFTAGFKRLKGLDLLEFTVRDLTATVAFPCDTGDVTQAVGPDPKDLDAGLLTLEPTKTGGILRTTLVPPGATDPSADLEATLAGSSASGTLDLRGDCPDASSVSRTSINFTASRTG